MATTPWTKVRKVTTPLMFSRTTATTPLTFSTTTGRTATITLKTPTTASTVTAPLTISPLAKTLTS